MNGLQELNQLDKRNKELALLIDTAVQNNDTNRYELKKELHENKNTTLRNRHTST